MADFAYVQLPPWGIQSPPVAPITAVAGFRSLLGLWMGGNVGVPAGGGGGGGSERDWRSSQAWHRSYTT